MSEKTLTPILYVCTSSDCTFSAPGVGSHPEDKPYGYVSAKPGEAAVCPVCGAKCTTVEDGRHRFLRLNSARLGVIIEKMKLVGNTMKGAQYEPTVDDLKRVRAVLYANFDQLGKLIDAKEEKLINPDAVKATDKVKTRKKMFSL